MSEGPGLPAAKRTDAGSVSAGPHDTLDGRPTAARSGSPPSGLLFPGLLLLDARVTQPSLLLLIPAYNEERRIEPVLREYARYFQEHYQGKFQMVVVLNG